MSTPDQPESPQLTRKQLRELRNTGVTPVITESTAPADDAPSAPVGPPAPSVFVAKPAAPAPSPSPDAAAVTSAAAAPTVVAPAPVVPAAAAPTVVAPLPRAAEPVVIPPAPVADASVDLGTAPLTRRQARQQERIRTASVPVITPEVAASVLAPQAVPIEPATPARVTESPAADDAPTRLIARVPAAPAFAGPTAPAPALPTEDPAHPLPDHRTAPEDDDLRIFEDEGGTVDTDESRATVSPTLGAGLLQGAAVSEPVTSFDQLLQRDTATTGSVAGPSTLIVSQAPAGAPLVAPVAATGEVIVTGSWNLPEGMGSTGHAPGTTDGKEIDAALVDGELPTHSSPTPIAASAAVSTAVTPDEIITPPAPEKGNKLMLSLAITAGVLAVALIGVLVFALATGVFK